MHRAEVAAISRAFMKDGRAAFPDLAFAGTAPLIAQGGRVVGRGLGGATHAEATFSAFLLGSLPSAMGRTMRFSSTTALRIAHGRIAEGIGLDVGVKALTQLGLVAAKRARFQNHVYNICTINPYTPGNILAKLFSFF